MYRNGGNLKETSMLAAQSGLSIRTLQRAAADARVLDNQLCPKVREAVDAGEINLSRREATFGVIGPEHIDVWIEAIFRAAERQDQLCPLHRAMLLRFSRLESLALSGVGHCDQESADEAAEDPADRDAAVFGT
jgi:hypothetical protein